MDTFGKWLVEQRESKGLSQNKLAERMRFSQAAVSRVEADKVEPSDGFLTAAADVLQIPKETIYRAAGMLPPKSKRDELIEEAEHLFSQLESEENKQMALNFLRMLQGDKKKDNRSPRRSTLVNK